MTGLAHAFCSVDWELLVRVLSALLTPIIALLAAYIAWQQYKNNKNQFRLALFERRLTVFNSAGELIGTVLREANAEIADLTKFLWGTRESEFLFGADIAAYLKELYGKAADVHALAGRAEQAQAQGVALRWFSGQGDELKKKFGIYMAFKESD